jgi:hypothetical protein
MSSPCAAPVNFPATIDNRPSLPRIQYRIGRYSDFRAQMLSLLDQSPLLRGWTHRQADDPGIALIEGAAILGDILTFYQELYANEAWLGTATWPQSIAAIVRLIGYRPAPGLGGTGYVAFEIDGSATATVPVGFPFSAQIVGMSAPANFETSQSLVAFPGLSRFSLYRPSSIPIIITGQNTFALNATELTAAGVTVKAQDRLMLVDKSNAANRQIVVAKSVTTQLDQTVVTTAGGWQGSNVSGGMTAYKLGRTFRAFGYNAPATQVTVKSDGTISTSDVETGMDLNTMLEGFPLERRVDDLSAGILMLLDIPWTRLGHPGNYFSSMTALSVSNETDFVGPMQAGITTVAFEKPSGTLGYYIPKYADRRTAVCYEVIGQGVDATGVREIDTSADTSELDYFGDGTSYEALDQRLLQFVALNPDDTAARVEEAKVSIDRTAVGNASQVAVRRLSLAPSLTQFTAADFPLASSGVIVLGNVAPMTQGKTQPVAALGNGDARQIYQSFQLPKAPLTWLMDEDLTPPRKPKVTILVNDIEWTEVDSLFASGAKDQVYILREDDAGNTWVQFGDGVNGAVLPSGINNVTAQYRTGNAANGWRQSGAKPQAMARVPNLSQVRLYDEVTQGTADEDSSHVRQTAPSRVEELGRIVSLSDFEYEALALPGVEKARAVWDTQSNVPLLKLTVLLSDDTPAQLKSVQGAMSRANADRGTDRFPVLVVGAELEYVRLSLTIGLLTGYQSDPVITAVKAALGVVPSDGSPAPMGGLFSLDRRSLGQEEYSSRIEGTVQNVEGVAWVEVTGLGGLGTAEEPWTLLLHFHRLFSPTVACADDRLLALYESHFSAQAGGA